MENVERNFSVLGQHVGATRLQVKGVHQVHSARVVEVTSAAQVTKAEKADGLLCGVPGLVVGVKTADCVPVLLASPPGGGRGAVVAALHAGWRGVVDGIVAEAIAQMGERVGDDEVSASLLVAIGPHICADCFQVGPEVAALFPGHRRPDPGAAGKSLVDLRGALSAQAVALGVPDAQIDQVWGCTMCDPEGRFFSHRGSGGACGRMFNFIGALV